MKRSAPCGRLSSGGASRLSRLLLRGAVCLVFAGCEACGGSGTASTTSSAVVEPSAGAPVPSQDEPAPALHLRVESTLANAAQLVMEVHGDAPVALAPRVRVERRRDGAYVPLERAEMTLRFDCDQPAAECLSLVPGAAFHPPPWSPDRGQCDCTDCAVEEPAPFRFVVVTCSGQHSLASDPWDPSGDFGAPSR